MYNKRHLPPLLKHAGDDPLIIDATKDLIPDKGYDRILISGSEETILADLDWIEAQAAFLRRAVEKDMPILGICFGHQMIARALWGKEAVARNPVPEFGFDVIHITGKDIPLFQGVPKTFRSFNAHFDRVVKTTDGLIVLAHSDHCEIHAMKVRDRPAYGVQFHPEVNKEEGKRIFEDILPDYPEIKHQLEAGVENAVECEATPFLFRNFHGL